MATTPTDPNQIDRLSILPDELLITILSLLPTRVAATTSFLSRRFRHLWKASPSVDLSTDHLSSFKSWTFAAMARSALLSRKPSNPLLSLRLQIDSSYIGALPDSFFSSLLVKAHSLGVRHLAVDEYWHIQPILPSIFSIDSLESLSLPTLTPMTLPSTVTLTRLKSLSFSLNDGNSTEVNRLLSQLSSLEHLRLRLAFTEVFNLSSCTIRKLELLILGDTMPETEFVGLSIPSLEIFHLETEEDESLPRIEGDIPLLRKAVITLHDIHETDVSAIAGLLNCISHAEELSLHINESEEEEHPFPILLEPGKDVPNFPNLKDLYVSMCFHEHNFEAVVVMLRHSPALKSLKLVHEAPDSYTFRLKRRKRNDWRSKLPRNSDGNRNYAYLVDLHLQENNKGFIKLLNRKCSPKRLRLNN